ncbi:hypothetical protein AXF21_05600 [Eubacterium minutum ATCC 700079]|nr:hypothetical protein AXF21_05600 [Eubacterium minutum ATCC 700079]
MDVTEKWGDDVDSAVELALAELKLTREEVDVTVLEEPSRGFFGIGSKLALVRVEKKKEKKSSEAQEEKKLDKKIPEDNGSKKSASEEKKADKTVKVVKEEADRSVKDKKAEKVVKEEKTFDIFEEMKDLPPCENHEAKDFLQEVILQMGLKLDLTVNADDNNVYLKIEGADSGTIIGKRGQTLDAIQYLTSLVVNKDKSDYVKVVIDAENYRARRAETLEKLAHRLAGKVVRTRRPVKLEPMNPYERKVIHSTLQDDPEVLTRSEGEDPYRKIIIELK